MTRHCTLAFGEDSRISLGNRASSLSLSLLRLAIATPLTVQFTHRPQKKNQCNNTRRSLALHPPPHVRMREALLRIRIPSILVRNLIKSAEGSSSLPQLLTSSHLTLQWRKKIFLNRGAVNRLHAKCAKKFLDHTIHLQNYAHYYANLALK